jgi:hypothetical protein
MERAVSPGGQPAPGIGQLSRGAIHNPYGPESCGPTNRRLMAQKAAKVLLFGEFLLSGFFQPGAAFENYQRDRGYDGPGKV